MKKSKLAFGILTILAGIMARLTCQGAAWEGADDFSAGISSANWATLQNIQGQMTVAGANGHASFLVSGSTTNEESAGILWNGTPTAAEDWTANILGYNAANWSANGDSQLQLYVVDAADNSRAFRISMAGSGAPEFNTKSYPGLTPDDGILRQSVPATNLNFGLRLVHTGGLSGAFESWYDPTGNGSNWTWLDAMSLTDFAPSLTATNTLLIGVIANCYYGPITEGQLWADNFQIKGTGAAASSGTNVVATLGVALTGFQGTDSSKPVRADTKAILSFLNGVLTNSVTGTTVTNNFVDGSGRPVNGARLLMVFPADPDAGGTTFRVRQVVNRVNIVDTDVSPWLWISEQPSVRNGKAGHEVFEVSLNNGNGVSFDVQGFASFTKGDLIGTSGKAKGVIIRDHTKAATATVIGTGYLPLAAGASDSWTVLKGSMVLTAAAVDVQ
jgi:hypothetical protein